jgi:tetratricopeptide (TPR) repeat protein
MTIGRIFLVLVVLGGIGFGIYKFGMPETNVSVPEADPFTAADTEFGRSNYQQAINEYRAAIEKDPNSERVVEAYYRIALSYDKMSNRDEAIKAYGDFLAKYPKDNRAQNARSREEYFRSSN